MWTTDDGRKLLDMTSGECGEGHEGGGTTAYKRGEGPLPRSACISLDMTSGECDCLAL